MKTIYLVRHAKSSWQYPELDDFERPLNRRGRESLIFMGEILCNLKVAPEIMLSSPANRAAMTARGIAAAVNYPLDKIQYIEAIYMASEGVLLELIRSIKKSVNEVMVIGHNPGLTDLANYIGDRRIDNIPTCGVFCLDLDIMSWLKTGEHCGRLKFFELPQKQAS